MLNVQSRFIFLTWTWVKCPNIICSVSSGVKLSPTSPSPRAYTVEIRQGYKNPLKAENSGIGWFRMITFDVFLKFLCNPTLKYFKSYFPLRTKAHCAVWIRCGQFISYSAWGLSYCLLLILKLEIFICLLFLPLSHGKLAALPQRHDWEWQTLC